MLGFWIQNMPMPTGSSMPGYSLIKSPWSLKPLLPMSQLQQITFVILIERMIKDCGREVTTLRDSYSCYSSSPSATGNASHFQHWRIYSVPQRSPSTSHFAMGRATNSSLSSQRQNNCFLYSTPSP